MVKPTKGLRDLSAGISEPFGFIKVNNEYRKGVRYEVTGSIEGKENIVRRNK